MPVKIKICGLTDETAVRAVIAAKADYAGFVFFPRSPRHLPLEQAAKLKALLPDSIQSVAVLVDPDDALLAQVRDMVKPGYIQLHGAETPQRVADIRKAFPSLKIIKAVAVRSGDDVASAMPYAAHADFLMFDAKPIDMPGALPGGNGLRFDWALMKGRDFPLPWFLSGGLTPDNVAEAIHATGATMVDVSSGVERAPGVKDDALIRLFIERARSTCT